MEKFTEENIRKMLYRWYRQIDEHSPVENFRDLLASQGLYIDLPPAPACTFEEFSQWYEANNTKFFDGKHTIFSIRITFEKERALADIELNWTVHTWEPPSARSTRISLDMTAKAGIIPGPEEGYPVLQTYQALEHL